MERKETIVFALGDAVSCWAKGLSRRQQPECFQDLAQECEPLQSLSQESGMKTQGVSASLTSFHGICSLSHSPRTITNSGFIDVDGLTVATFFGSRNSERGTKINLGE